MISADDTCPFDFPEPAPVGTAASIRHGGGYPGAGSSKKKRASEGPLEPSEPPARAASAGRPGDVPNETRAAAHLLFLTGWEPWRVANALSIRKTLARRWKAETDAAVVPALAFRGARPDRGG